MSLTQAFMVHSMEMECWRYSDSHGNMELWDEYEYIRKKEATETKVFRADGKLEERLQTWDAVWVYLRKYLFPWQQDNNARLLLEFTRLRPSLRPHSKPLCSGL